MHYHKYVALYRFDRALPSSLIPEKTVRVASARVQRRKPTVPNNYNCDCNADAPTAKQTTSEQRNLPEGNEGWESQNSNGNQCCRRFDAI